MDLFLSRQEIRRQILEETGYSSDVALASQDLNRINAYIDQASLQVAGKCRWISMQRRATVPIDEDVTALSYRELEIAYWNEKRHPNDYYPLTYHTPADTWEAPDLASYPLANVGPAGITEVAYWEEVASSYVWLKKAHEYADQSQDRWGKRTNEVNYQGIYEGKTQTEIDADVQAASAERQRQRAAPYTYEALIDGLVIWPIPEKRYLLRVHYDVTPTWRYNQQLTSSVIDQQTSLVDAIALINFAAAKVYAQQGDDFQYKNYMQLADQRIRELQGRHNTGEPIMVDDTASFKEYQFDRGYPQWNNGPRGPAADSWIR